MVFEKQDKLAWMDSEVMQELEKIAIDQDLLNGPSDAFSPVNFNPEKEEKEDDQWEEEDEATEEKLLSAIEKMENKPEGTLEEELEEVYSNSIISTLKKMAQLFAVNSNMKVAHRIEQCVYELQSIKGGK